MSLRLKFILTIVLTNMVLLGIVYFIGQTILLSSIEKLEIQQASGVIERTAKIVQKRVETLANTNRDYAVWDDTYNYIEEQNESYIQSNYLDETFNINNIDAVAIYSAQNERLFTKSYAPEQQATDLSVLFNDILLAANGTARSGLYLFDQDTIFLYSIHPVTSSDGKAQSNGSIMMFRRLDSVEKTTINDQVGRAIVWRPFESVNYVMTNKEVTTAARSLPVEGKGYVSIETTVQRDITKNITAVRDQILIGMMLIAILMILGTYSFVNRNVLLPVKMIVNAIQSINTLSSKQQFIQLTTNDEFEKLSIEINHMLLKLKKGQDQVINAQTEIAKQKAIEEKKDEFFSIASHELRTPLTAIRGNVEYLKSSYAELLDQNGELKESLNDMHNASMRLIELVNDFLSTSRLDSNKMTPLIAEYDAHTAIMDVVQELEQPTKSAGLKIEVKQPTKPIHLMADLQFLREILQNLIGNSIKFTPAGGQISLEVEEKAELVQILVKDNGRGIAIAEQGELFQRFRQANEDPLTRDTTKGSGLGLYIARKMARTMNGDVQLLQSDSGKGATFSITLPKAGVV